MFDSNCDLAAIVYENGAAPDELLRAFASRLRAQGHKPVGLIQYGRNCHSAPEFSITLVHTGENLRVLEDRGSGARGCRLDVERLLDAGMRVAAAMDEDTSILIINRFGKQEQEGKGLLFLIEKAMSLNVPVLIAVPRERFPTWLAFSSGMSVMLHSDPESLDRWWTSVAAGASGDAPVGECHAMMQPMGASAD